MNNEVALSQVMTFPVIVKIPVDISIQTQTPRVFALDGNEIVLHPKVIEWMQAQRRYAGVFNNKHPAPVITEKPKRKKGKQ